MSYLGDKKVADIVITNHAKSRWADRVESERTGFEDIADFMWQCLKQGRIEPYYRNEQDVYLIDDDLGVRGRIRRTGERNRSGRQPAAQNDRCHISRQNVRDD